MLAKLVRVLKSYIQTSAAPLCHLKLSWLSQIHQLSC